jgi:hypothetical protein
MVVDLKSGYDEVFTVTEYCDGPRQGIADFKGRPHFYDCVFSDTNDDYTDVYRLTPISPEVSGLAKEDWVIWRKWESAFHAGKTTLEIPPGAT